MSLTIDDSLSPIKVTGTTSTTQTITSGKVFIRFVYWYQPTAQGHLFTLKDAEGKDVTAGYCETANVSQWIPIFSSYNGLASDDMDSGTLYIYIR